MARQVLVPNMPLILSIGVGVILLPPVVVCSSQPACPAGASLVDTFDAEGERFLACEDLALPGGGITLVPFSGDEAVHLPKTYEQYAPHPDSHYYLGLDKEAVLRAKWDLLADAVLNDCSAKAPTTGPSWCEPTWSRVELALPVMRYSFGNRKASGNTFMCSPYSPESGVRTFTGSRSASVDATFSDHVRGHGLDLAPRIARFAKRERPFDSLFNRRTTAQTMGSRGHRDT